MHLPDANHEGKDHCSNRELTQDSVDKLVLNNFQSLNLLVCIKEERDPHLKSNTTFVENRMSIKLKFIDDEEVHQIG